MGGTLVVQAATNTANATPYKIKPARNVVILAIDESPQAEVAFKWYAKFVHKPGDFVRVTHCRGLVGLDTLAEEYKIKGSSWESMVADAMGGAKPLLDKYEARLKENKLDGTVDMVFGNPGESLISAAKEHKATLIVMGTRGLGIIRRAILGSVSYFVLSNTNVPVTIVPDETRHLPLDD